ncbi:MAG: hypothetical protein PHN90_07985 [Methanothrix sp.]|jgi:hypothetical protein|nr:hypothetical protein [Methanothrix sp.]
MARQKLIYKTASGGKIQTARAEARRARQAAQKLEAAPEAEVIVAGLEAEARAKTEEAEDLWNAARLEALTVYKGDVVKKTKAGEATYTYWFASWREDGKVVNKYLGSVEKMDLAAATAKARKLKAEALGL